MRLRMVFWDGDSWISLERETRGDDLEIKLDDKNLAKSETKLIFWSDIYWLIPILSRENILSGTPYTRFCISKAKSTVIKLPELAPA